MRRTLVALALVGLAVAPTASSAATLRRLALVAGANRATPDRVPLRYAVSDAERFAEVVTRLGGVAAGDCLTLREPSRQAFLDALEVLRGRVGAARAQAERVEVLLYYSGHADEKGLLLGRDLVAYRELRDGLAALSADVAVAVLDACASGAITRLKGGQTHPAFMTDVNSQTSGYAFLTSSAENEAAQESERIGGSYFTYALLSGLRGGADASGDGKVTLGEAYQFAFQETLAQTAPTEAGAQHPSWDIKMSGTGDVVMTDVRQTSSSLILEPDMEGRFFVRNARRQLVAELFKPAGRSVELGLEPGEYEVHFDQPAAYFKTRLRLADGQRRVLVRQELEPSRRILTRRRGGWEAAPGSHGLALNGRSRVEMRFGFSEGGVRVSADQQATDVTGGQFALSGLHWLREDLAIEVAFRVSDMDVSTRSRFPTETTNTSGVMSFLFGARLYAPAPRLGAPLRPYIAAAVGPHTDVRVTTVGQDSSWASDHTNLALHVGGGVDLLLGRHVVIGAYTGTTLRSGHETRLGGGLVWGWEFGRGRSRD